MPVHSSMETDPFPGSFLLFSHYFSYFSSISPSFFFFLAFMPFFFFFPQRLQQNSLISKCAVGTQSLYLEQSVQGCAAISANGFTVGKAERISEQQECQSIG